MVTMNDYPMRVSLQVAPLDLQRSISDAPDPGQTHNGEIVNNIYSTTYLTPPATPNASNENLTDTNDVYAFQNYLRAFYPFQPSQTMVDSTVTLPLNEGDVVLVHSIHTNGWADGTLLVSGARGWLPTNYCESYDPTEMRDLLKALLNFWDLLRSTAVDDHEIFGNQEFMKGIIAGVRSLLERTTCLTRESPLIQQHDGLKRSRKSLLSELSSLVKTAKRLQEQQKAIQPSEDVNDIIDEMILKACKIVTKAVRFLDMTQVQVSMLLPTVLVDEQAPSNDNVMAPPTPPAEASMHHNDVDDKPKAEEITAHSATNTAPLPNAICSTDNARHSVRGSSHGLVPRPTSTNRFSVGSSHQHNRLSASISQRLSLAGPLPLLQPHNLVSERLTRCHDTFLSYLASFIGRLHLQAQSRPHLAAAIEQSTAAGKDLLIVVDVVSSHTISTRDILELPRAAMYDRIVDLVYIARDILVTHETEAADVITPEDNGKLLSASAGCVKATGECVAKTKWVIEKTGDFEYAFGDVDPIPQPDLSSLSSTEITAIEIPPFAESTVASESVAGSVTASLSDVLPPRTSSRAASQHAHNISVDKPYPLLPPPAEIICESAEILPPSESCVLQYESSTGGDSHSRSTSSVLSFEERPVLPVLPRISTMLPSEDAYNSIDSPDSHDDRSSYRPGSLQASSSGASSSYLSRDSETSLRSQSSTRATTPELQTTPRGQPSLSDLSNAAAEEADDFESRLLEKTYAQELMFNKEGHVTGGSLNALVERLTTHESTPDAILVSTFYLTFRMFCTPAKFAETLIARFEYVSESPHMASVVRLRVYNVFKGWLESHWREDTDRGALVLIRDFADFRLSPVLPSAGKRLASLIERVSSTNCTLVPRLVSSMGKTNTVTFQYVSAETPLPAPVLLKTQAQVLNAWKAGGNCPSIMDFDPLEVARQLTLRQANIFCSVMPEELLGSQWMKKGGAESPNVKAMTTLSTELSNMVADTILHHPEPKKRAIIVKQWIKIAHRCLELNNYDALMAILCSLSSSTITRLRKTWDAVSPRRKELLASLQAIVEPSQNHKVLRARLAEHVPPTLPFLGMFLTDLTFVDIGNPATKQLQGTDGQDLTIVNFDKHAKTAKIIGELQRFQIPYRLTEVPDMQSWLQAEINRVHNLDPGTNMQVKYYRQSLMLEPRESTQRVAEVSVATNTVQNMFGWRR